MSPTAPRKPRARPKPAGKVKRKTAEPGRGAVKRAGWRRVVRTGVIALIIVALVPLLLVPAYVLVPPIGTHMIATRIADGPIERSWVHLDDVAKVLAISVMMSEDGRFCAHHGVDWEALEQVIETPGGPQRGASTIAMQTVRNLFLWQSRSYLRKGLEIPLALYADLVWSKRREMEIYLNIAQWGPAIFGVEAAAQHYFGRSAGNLNARQAALLAVALPNPILRNPANPSARMNRLARTVESRARSAGGYIHCLYD
ncbi:MAG: monofunctional biosynthetic peptidoglycan transglycosylase [Hyphomicrobiales bacterium]|nr:monofunctional biosynthetic peptidoglycan transglycosylase [Hyphomicrobiales bacterium]